MRRTKVEKKRLRDARWRQLRFKRYKGDHDYLIRETRANAIGCSVLPFPVIIERGVPIGLIMSTPRAPHVIPEPPNEVTFGPAIDLLSSDITPPGITTVATSFEVPGELQVSPEIHHPECGIFKPGSWGPIDCTCGFYHHVVLAGGSR